MVERLEYAVDSECRVKVTVPKDIMHEALSERNDLYAACRDNRDYIDARATGRGAFDVIIDTSRMSHRPSETRKTQLKRVVGSLSELENMAAGFDASDELVRMDIAKQWVGYGAHPTLASFERPHLSDERASNLGTQVMRRIKSNLSERQHASPAVISEIGADFNTEKGVSFVVSSIGACSMDTNGDTYRPDSSRIEVFGHNLYSPEMQLLCLSGIIAVATHRRGRETQNPLL